MSENLCIYHGNCADGFSSAWVVKKAMEELNKPIDFHAGVYQALPPDVEDKNIILVDFSYKRPVLQEILSKAKSVLILDHHKTAADDLKDLSGAQVVFDMERAGCMITWDYFFAGKTPPKLLEHVQDRDLWKFILPNTREIQANMFSYPYDFAIWDRLMDSDPQILATEGKAIERKHFKDIEELVKVTSRPMRIKDIPVLVANLPYTMSSDAGHMLLNMNQPFGCCYWDTPEGRVFSLRSDEQHQDVSEIAKFYGGGGHRNAAGFKVSFEIARSFE